MVETQSVRESGIVGGRGSELREGNLLGRGPGIEATDASARFHGVGTRSNAAAVFSFLAKVSGLARAWQKGARRDRSTSPRRCIPRAFDAFLRDLMHPRAFAIPPGAAAVR